MLLPKRIWKDIKGYEGIFQVANIPYADKRQVRSLDRWVNNSKTSKRLAKGKLLKGYSNNSGYLCINLNKGNKATPFTIHKLVALHFVDGYFEGAVVNHKDENKQNNIWTNLEFCTPKENMNHGTVKDRIGEANRGKKRTEEFKEECKQRMKGEGNPHYGKKHTEEAKKSMSDKKSRPIKCIETGQEFTSAREVIKWLGYGQTQNIRSCCKGRNKSAYGLHFEYVDELNCK